MLQKFNNSEQILIKNSDFISRKTDNYSNEMKVMKAFCIQKREDYTRYDKLSRDIRVFANKINDLDPSSAFRVELIDRLLDKLYQTGLIPAKWDLSLAAHVSASSFCRRRLPVVMVQNKMSDNLKEATEFIEKGNIQVGAEVIKDPAFLVSRALEGFVTWVNGSCHEKHV